MIPDGGMINSNNLSTLDEPFDTPLETSDINKYRAGVSSGLINANVHGYLLTPH